MTTHGGRPEDARRAQAAAPAPWVLAGVFLGVVLAGASSVLPVVPLPGSGADASSRSPADARGFPMNPHDGASTTGTAPHENSAASSLSLFPALGFRSLASTWAGALRADPDLARRAFPLGGVPRVAAEASALSEASAEASARETRRAALRAAMGKAAQWVSGGVALATAAIVVPLARSRDPRVFAAGVLLAALAALAANAAIQRGVSAVERYAAVFDAEYYEEDSFSHHSGFFSGAAANAENTAVWPRGPAAFFEPHAFGSARSGLLGGSPSVGGRNDNNMKTPPPRVVYADSRRLDSWRCDELALWFQSEVPGGWAGRYRDGLCAVGADAALVAELSDKEWRSEVGVVSRAHRRALIEWARKLQAEVGGAKPARPAFSSARRDGRGGREGADNGKVWVGEIVGGGGGAATAKTAKGSADDGDAARRRRRRFADEAGDEGGDEGGEGGEGGSAGARSSARGTAPSSEGRSSASGEAPERGGGGGGVKVGAEEEAFFFSFSEGASSKEGFSTLPEDESVSESEKDGTPRFPGTRANPPRFRASGGAASRGEKKPSPRRLPSSLASFRAWRLADRGSRTASVVGLANCPRFRLMRDLALGDGSFANLAGVLEPTPREEEAAASTSRAPQQAAAWPRSSTLLAKNNRGGGGETTTRSALGGLFARVAASVEGKTSLGRGGGVRNAAAPGKSQSQSRARAAANPSAADSSSSSSSSEKVVSGGGSSTRIAVFPALLFFACPGVVVALRAHELWGFSSFAGAWGIALGFAQVAMFCHGACELLETRFVAGAGRRRFLTREAARRYSNADARRWLAQRGLYPGLARMAFLELLVTPIAKRAAAAASGGGGGGGFGAAFASFACDGILVLGAAVLPAARVAYRAWYCVGRGRGTQRWARARRDEEIRSGGGEGRRGRRRVRLRGGSAPPRASAAALCSTTRRTTVGRVRTRSGRVRRTTTTTTKPVGFRSPGETRTHPRGTRTRRRGIGIGIPASSRRVREGGAPSSYRGSSDEGSRRWIRGGSSRRRTTRA